MKKLILIIALCYANINGNAQLAGIYTIGGSNPDFASINAASQALSNQGISGNVTFNIRSGIYNTTSIINYIPNACYFNQVIFQSETGNPDDVIFRSHGYNNDAYTIKLSQANFVTLQDITIENTDNGSYCLGNVVQAIECYSCKLYNCKINGGYTPNGSADYKAAIRIKHAYESLSTSFTIQNCIINTLGFGIYVSGSVGNTYVLNNVIQNKLRYSYYSSKSNYTEIRGNWMSDEVECDISANLLLYDNTILGVIDFSGSNIKVENNNIIGDTNYMSSYSSISGCVLQSFNNNVFGNELHISNITSPKIKYNTFNELRISYSYDLLFYGNTVDSLDLVFTDNSNISRNKVNKYLHIGLFYHGGPYNNLLINNFISGVFSMGINSYWNIYHNNFDLYLIDMQLVDHLNIINNNFKIPYNIVFNIPSSTTDYNNYYPNGGSNEIHHFNLDPQYVSGSDLHVQNMLLKGLAEPIITVIDDVDGDSRGTSNTIGADELCLPNIFTAGNDTTISCGDSLLIKSTFNHLANYLWYPSIGLSDTTVARPKAAPSSTTTYYVTAFDMCANFMDSITISVIPFQVDAGNDYTFSCGAAHQLKATYNAGAIYSWTPPDGLNNSDIHNPIAIPIDTTIYYVTATIQNCPTSIDSVKMILNGHSVAAFSCIVYSNTAEFINTSIFPAYYYWDFGDGYFSTDYNPYHSYNNAGFYTVTLHVITECGTEDSIIKVINYNVSIDEYGNETSKLLCLPNPATTTLTIENLSTSATAEVYDLSGKLLFAKQLNTNKIDIRSLAKGLYFIKLSNVEGSVVKKFVKE